MLAIIPAAGKGTRLRPLTDITSKPLLPVYNKPMVFYPLLTLREAGIRDIVMVVDNDNREDFETFFRDGSDFGFNIKYVVQSERLGIAHAISMAEGIAKGQEVIVIHGDNIFEGSIVGAVERFNKQNFKINNAEIRGGKVILTKVEDPERFGVAELDGEKVIGLEEKPEHPKSNWITTGLYMFDARVFDIIRTLKPSGRGEYEVTDICKFYLNEGTLTCEKLKGKWFDVGTIDALHEASDYIAQNERLREQQL